VFTEAMESIARKAEAGKGAAKLLQPRAPPKCQWWATGGKISVRAAGGSTVGLAIWRGVQTSPRDRGNIPLMTSESFAALAKCWNRPRDDYRVIMFTSGARSR